MRSVFQEVVQLTTVPLTEKLCQNMFQQINDSFLKGTNDCKDLYLYIIVMLVGYLD